MEQRVKVFRDRAGEWRWTRYVGAEPVSDSDEGYVHKDHCLKEAGKLNERLPIEVVE